MTRLPVRSPSIATVLLGGGVVASLVGAADAQVVLSNLSSYVSPPPSSQWYTVNHIKSAAIQFSTGAGSWSLNQVHLKGGFSFVSTMQIWSNVAGQPGAAVGTSAPLVADYPNRDIRYGFSGVTLSANTDYWMVFSGGWIDAFLTTATPTASGSSGWGGNTTSLRKNGANPWTASADTFFYEIQATSLGGGAVPLPGAAGLAACGLLGLSRRRRR